jgi:hypothetical protein
MTVPSRLRSGLFLLGWWLLLVKPVSAYEVETHRQLSDSAFTLSRIVETLQDTYAIEPDARFRQHIIGLPGGRRTPQEWVVIGGVYEDFPVWRVLNHFYDPLRNQGLGVLGGVAAPDWALEPSGPIDGQNHSYRDARDAFYQGLTASSPDQRERELGFTFFALGHVIHLIQDVAQPQHTRRDVHPPFTRRASFIEAYLDRNVTDFALGGAVVPAIAHPRELWTTSDGAGLADYTNASFVSAGTNFTDLRDGATGEGYPKPALSLALQGSIDPSMACRDGAAAPASLTVFGNQIVDRLTGETDLNPSMTTHSVFDQRLIERGEAPVFALNCFNIDAQADRLLPRAVAYSAALLRYFFRGQLAVEVTDAGVRIANGTPDETMTGTFELYYDTDDGTRHRLSSWTVQIPPEHSSPVLSTARLRASETATPCMFVFRGALGQESDAVAGVFGPCPFEAGSGSPGSGDPPTPPPGDPPIQHFTQWWCFDRDAWGQIGGPIQTSVPVGQDPVAWLQAKLNPGIVVLRCDPFVGGAPAPTF